MTKSYGFNYFIHYFTMADWCPVKYRFEGGGCLLLCRHHSWASFALLREKFLLFVSVLRYIHFALYIYMYVYFYFHVPLCWRAGLWDGLHGNVPQWGSLPALLFSYERLSMNTFVKFGRLFLLPWRRAIRLYLCMLYSFITQTTSSSSY